MSDTKPLPSDAEYVFKVPREWVFTLTTGLNGEVSIKTVQARSMAEAWQKVSDMELKADSHTEVNAKPSPQPLPQEAELRQTDIKLWSSGGNLNMKLREFAIRYAGTDESTEKDYFAKSMEDAVVQLFTEHSRKTEIKAFDGGWDAAKKDTPPSIQAVVEFRQDQYGWNDTKMAAMLDMQLSHYSEFKHGKRNLPVNSIRKAYAIGVPASILLADQNTLALSNPLVEEGK